MSHSTAFPRGGRRPRLSPVGGWVVFVLVMLLLVFVVAFFFLGRGWIASYDDAHPVALICTIDSAKSSAVSTHSGRGVGTYVDQVDLQTADCGHLVLRDGVTAQNSDAVAARFRSGDEYRLTIGEASVKLRGLLALLGTVPEVRSYGRE